MVSEPVTGYVTAGRILVSASFGFEHPELLPTLSTMTETEIPNRWKHIDYLLQRSSAFTAPNFVPDTPAEPTVRSLPSLFPPSALFVDILENNDTLYCRY